MGQYENLSFIYDGMIDVDYDRWISFITEYISRNKIIGKSALEIGCGTGNMTLRLKENGFDVIALDSSEDMLASAQDKLFKKRHRVRFLKGDAKDFKIDKKFDFAFSFCDVYNYITDENDLIRCFKNAYKHLNQDGVFIFDISTNYKLKNIIGNNTFTMNRDDLCYIWDNYIEDDLVEMYITFFIPKGQIYMRVDENHIQRAYDIEFIKESLISSGFRNVEIYSDYSFDKINDDDLRATFIAKK